MDTLVGGILPQYLPASSFLITCWGWGLYQGSRPMAEGIGDRLRIFGLSVQSCCEGRETCVRSWCFESLCSIHMSLCTKSYTRPLVILSHNVSHRTQAISGVSSCSKAIVLPLLLWFFGCLPPSLAWGPWVVHAPDGDRDYRDIAMRQWNKRVNLHHSVFLILTSMCMFVHVCLMCECQFLHPQKGNSNTAFLTGC